MFNLNNITNVIIKRKQIEKKRKNIYNNEMKKSENRLNKENKE